MAEIAQPATPMMRQYLEVKSRYPDAILFFRLGDFYEMFAEDAVVAAEALQITLTSRAKGDGKIPMCGVPYHAARGYVARLLDRGFKVAICDQVEPPGKGGIVKREVTRVVTPGTVLDEQSLDPRESSFLGAVALDPEGDGGGLALLDATTGELRCGEVGTDARLGEELRKAGVRELVVARSAAALPRASGIAREVGAPVAEVDDAAFQRAAEKLSRHLGVAGLDGFGVGHLPRAVAAASAALHYLSETQRTEPRHVDRVSLLPTTDVLLLDESTRANLEIERTLAGGKRKGSLLGLLDRTLTGAGGRRLRGVAALPAHRRGRHRRPPRRRRGPGGRGGAARAGRGGAPAGGRRRAAPLAAGPAPGQCPRPARARRHAVGAPRRGGPPRGDRSRPRSPETGRALRGLEDLAAVLERAVADEPPATTGEGGIIRRGWSEELDRIVELSENGKGVIASLEARERQRTGIGSLKVRYNRVFGYYIEITKPNLHLVPPDYQRRQTTVGGERFVTPELKELEEQVLGAEEKRVVLEERLFEELRGKVVSEAGRLRAAASAVATADAVLSLARVAAERGYRRPTLDGSESMEIAGGRHPVVEAMLPADSGGFVPNDLSIASSADPEGAQLLVITGPNMAGKSTVMRQAALIVLMAQAGSFVPAERARIGIVDRVFTRVGASDDLARGRSTFMVEMTETASILHNATRRSFVILDEIGRGTSTFDGLSIAWAVAERLHDRTGCRTLFATHYHELQDLARERPRVRNLTVAVREVGDRVVFLRKLVPGGASRSYGIEVAKLAGLPAEVLVRARESCGTSSRWRSTRPVTRPWLAAPGDGSAPPPTSSGSSPRPTHAWSGCATSSAGWRSIA